MLSHLRLRVVILYTAQRRLEVTHARLQVVE